MTGFHANDPGILDRVSGATPITVSAAGTLSIGRGRLLRFPSFHDPRGTIVVSQAPEDLPFVPVRLFQVSDVPPGEMRGDHAHRRCHQLIVAATGAVRVVVDDCVDRFSVRLDSPDLGLHLPPMTWSIQTEFSPGTRLLVLASEPYDRREYIDDYDEFISLRAT